MIFFALIACADDYKVELLNCWGVPLSCLGVPLSCSGGTPDPVKWYPQTGPEAGPGGTPCRRTNKLETLPFRHTTYTDSKMVVTAQRISSEL